MKREILFLLVSSIILLMTGCGEDESGEGSESSALVQGWHNQGKDCLACHNVDLQDERHLVFGGTVYKTKDNQNTDNLDTLCGGELNVNFWDAGRANLLFASKNYVDPNSKGNRGKGNIFILQRLFNVSANNYFIEITDKKGTVLASYLHKFSGEPYDINNPKNYNNRISCNACHSKGGGTTPIYVDSNKQNLCQ